MNITIGGNPLNQKDDKTVIFTEPRYMPSLTTLETFPKIRKNNVSKFVEHLYFITMERNGFSYFYPNFESDNNLCRFEWHYEYLGNPYELRIGFSFKVSKSEMSEVGYYILPQKNYENLELKKEPYSIDSNIYDNILEYINTSIDEALSRIEIQANTTYNILYYIELSHPVLDFFELTESIKVLPSRLVDGIIVSAVIIRELGHSYLSAKRFSDEKINLICTLISLAIDKAKLIKVERFPAYINPVDKEFDLSVDLIDKFYPGIGSGISGVNSNITDDDFTFVSKTMKFMDCLSSQKSKRRLKNILFSYYSAKETEGINRTVGLVSYVACLDAIAKEYCPLIRDENGSRKALVQTIMKLLSLPDQEVSIDKWSKRIYNEHRSSYVHGANIKFEEFSQNMDGKNFAGLPKALPNDSKIVSKQYEYASDYVTLKKVTLAVLIKHMENITNEFLVHRDLVNEINFLGDCVAEAHLSIPNCGWVKLT